MENDIIRNKKRILRALSLDNNENTNQPENLEVLPQSTPDKSKLQVWSPPRRKVWSPAETAMLQQGYRKYGSNAKMLKKIFDESNEISEQQIRDKIKTLRLNGLLQ